MAFRHQRLTVYSSRLTFIYCWSIKAADVLTVGAVLQQLGVQFRVSSLVLVSA